MQIRIYTDLKLVMMESQGVFNIYIKYESLYLNSACTCFTDSLNTGVGDGGRNQILHRGLKVSFLKVSVISSIMQEQDAHSTPRIVALINMCIANIPSLLRHKII